jgi:hypothetical protein
MISNPGICKTTPFSGIIAVSHIHLGRLVIPPSQGTNADSYFFPCPGFGARTDRRLLVRKPAKEGRGWILTPNREEVGLRLGLLLRKLPKLRPEDGLAGPRELIPEDSLADPRDELPPLRVLPNLIPEDSLADPVILS